MKKTMLFSALLTVSSVISAVIFRNPFTYFNLALSVVLLCLVWFSRNRTGAGRMKFSALWLLVLELAAFVLRQFGVNMYQPPLVWMMYAVYVVIEIFVTPRIDKAQ